MAGVIRLVPTTRCCYSRMARKLASRRYEEPMEDYDMSYRNTKVCISTVVALLVGSGSLPPAMAQGGERPARRACRLRCVSAKRLWVVDRAAPGDHLSRRRALEPGPRADVFAQPEFRWFRGYCSSRPQLRQLTSRDVQRSASRPPQIPLAAEGGPDLSQISTSSPTSTTCAGGTPK